MTPADRLTTAADRLESLSDDATREPWIVSPTPATKFACDVMGDEADLLVAGGISDEDAALIVALRPLALPIAAALRVHTGRLSAEVVTLPVSVERDYELHLHEKGTGCGAALPHGEAKHWNCRCFHPWLAVADAVLAATGGVAS